MARSSNYELYGDISSRVMELLGRYSAWLEVYILYPQSCCWRSWRPSSASTFFRDRMLIGTPPRPRIPLSCSPRASRGDDTAGPIPRSRAARVHDKLVPMPCFICKNLMKRIVIDSSG